MLVLVKLLTKYFIFGYMTNSPCESTLFQLVNPKSKFLTGLGRKNGLAVPSKN